MRGKFKELGLVCAIFILVKLFMYYYLFDGEVSQAAISEFGQEDLGIGSQSC